MSDYLSRVLKGKPEAKVSGDNLVPEEQALADALVKITDKYGKFNADNTGVWAGYDSAKKNAENAAIGVKCGNCVFFNAPNGCKIISSEVEEGGLCRFAVLPDGAVTPEKVFSKAPSLIQDELKEKISAMGDNYTEESVNISDLIPTQDYLDPAKLKDAGDNKKLITVYQDEEGFKIVDGHHRCAHKIGGGQTKIKAKMYRGPLMSAAMFSSTPISPDDIELSTEDPCWEGYKQIGMKKKNGKMVPNCVPDGALTADADYGGKCPPATQDIVLNIENRQNAIDNVGYGPLNPDEPNEEFWQDKADRWKITPVEASKSICGNCVFFDRRPKTLDCIETGIASGGSGDESAWGAIDQAELGYCTALDFKCAASRTCNAWAAGGPIVEDEQAKVASGGHGVSAPVLKEGDIKAPVNGKKLRLPMRNEIALRKKVLDYNTKNPQTPFTASVDMVKAVYRRGAGAYNGGEFSSQTRDDWSMNRVDAFLSLLANGKPANAAYTQDFDLLPLEHPKSTRGTASLTASAASDYSYELAVELMNEDDYESQEHAIHVLAEFSGLGYDVIPAIRAAWLRGLKNEENPYERAAILATALYSSPDADLLPKKGTL